MPFIKIEGFAGNIYVPEKNPGKQKHPCRDCYSCQFCSDERCGLCLRNKCCNKKPSPADEAKEGE
jgi:hypothetical protein